MTQTWKVAFSGGWVKQTAILSFPCFQIHLHTNSAGLGFGNIWVKHLFNPKVTKH